MSIAGRWFGLHVIAIHCTLPHRKQATFWVPTIQIDVFRHQFELVDVDIEHALVRCSLNIFLKLILILNDQLYFPPRFQSNISIFKALP